jgi:hypothetical protein
MGVIPESFADPGVMVVFVSSGMVLYLLWGWLSYKQPYLFRQNCREFVGMEGPLAVGMALPLLD